MPRAILSVADNTGLRDFARVLHKLGWDLVASQETAAYLQEAGLPVTSTEILTGAREMLGSRIRTLHPAIHAGIMASDSDADLAELATLGYAPISLVVCNVVPFQDLARQPGATLDGIMAAIDLDGMALLHAAAMNFSHMTALCDPADYGRVIALLRAAGRVDAANSPESCPQSLRRHPRLRHSHPRLPPGTNQRSYAGPGQHAGSPVAGSGAHLPTPLRIEPASIGCVLCPSPRRPAARSHYPGRTAALLLAYPGRGPRLADRPDLRGPGRRDRPLSGPGWNRLRALDRGRFRPGPRHRPGHGARFGHCHQPPAGRAIRDGIERPVRQSHRRA